MGCGHQFEGALRVPPGAERCVRWQSIQVIESVGSSFDRTESGVARGSVVEDGILVAILLVDKGEGDSCGSEAGCWGCLRGDPGGALPQLDILFAQRDSASGARRIGVFSNSEQKEEGQGDEITNGSEPGEVGVGSSHPWKPFDSVHREGQLRLGRGISISPFPEHIMETFVQGVPMGVHPPGIAEAPTDHDL